MALEDNKPLLLTLRRTCEQSRKQKAQRADQTHNNDLNQPQRQKKAPAGRSARYQSIAQIDGLFNHIPDTVNSAVQDDYASN